MNFTYFLTTSYDPDGHDVFRGIYESRDDAMEAAERMASEDPAMYVMVQVEASVEE